jgi:hypothetical protein
MMAVHRGLHGQHEMDHETEPGGMGLHPDDFSVPHDHPDRWLEHGSIPMPAGEPVGHSDPAHAVENNRPFELKPWHMNYSLSALADPYALVAQAATDPSSASTSRRHGPTCGLRPSASGPRARCASPWPRTA